MSRLQSENLMKLQQLQVVEAFVNGHGVFGVYQLDLGKVCAMHAYLPFVFNNPNKVENTRVHNRTFALFSSTLVMHKSEPCRPMWLLHLTLTLFTICVKCQWNKTATHVLIPNHPRRALVGLHPTTNFLQFSYNWTQEILLFVSRMGLLAHLASYVYSLVLSSLCTNYIIYSNRDNL